MDSLRADHRRSDSRADYRSQTDSSENFATGATEATFVCMTPTGTNFLLLSNFLCHTHSNNSHLFHLLLFFPPQEKMDFQ